MPLTEGEFDYVIVGAGSAGCVLADRLSADGKHNVLVLEFGGSDQSIYIQMPSALAIPMNTTRWKINDQFRKRRPDHDRRAKRRGRRTHLGPLRLA